MWICFYPFFLFLVYFVSLYKRINIAFFLAANCLETTGKRETLHFIIGMTALHRNNLMFYQFCKLHKSGVKFQFELQFLNLYAPLEFGCSLLGSFKSFRKGYIKYFQASINLRKMFLLLNQNFFISKLSKDLQFF